LTTWCGSEYANRAARLRLPLEGEQWRDAAFVNDHLSELRISQHRNHAGGRLSILLRLPGLRHADETETRRLLRVLFIWRCPVPSGPGGTRQRRADALLSDIAVLTHDDGRPIKEI